MNTAHTLGTKATLRARHHLSALHRPRNSTFAAAAVFTLITCAFWTDTALAEQGRTAKNIVQKPSSNAPKSDVAAPGSKKPVAGDSELRGHVEEILNARRSKFSSKAQIHIAVRELKTGKILYRTDDADKAGNLASVTKMITAAAALHFLGPGFTFQTKLLAKTRRNNTVDAIVLNTSGDPTLTEANLAALALAVRRQGIQKAKRVEIALPAMGRSRFPPEFDTKKTDAPYRAPVGGFNLNQNRVMVHIKPNASVGGVPRVSITPSADGIQVVNKAKTRAGKADRIGVAVKWGDNPLPTITISGSIGVQRKSGVTGVRLNKYPERWAAETFRTLLARSGVKVPAKAHILDSIPKGTYRITKYESAPLSEIVRHMLQHSDNQVAEALLLQLAGNSPEGVEHAISRVHRWLRAMNIPEEALVIRNGSGLYNGSAGSALAVTDMLTQIYNRQDIGPEFLAGLAVPGRPGTLAQRLRNLPSGTIRGKTGTLNEVSTLCGYALRHERKTAFCVLATGLDKAHRGAARELQDRVAEILHKPLSK